MKRAVSFALALILCLSISNVVFAANSTEFQQNWTSEINQTIYPENTGFRIESEPNNAPAITLTPSTNGSGTSRTVSVGLPQYTTAGVYEYTIYQNAGNIQGMTYDSSPIEFLVLAEYDGEVIRTTTMGFAKINEGKKASFENHYEVGTLTVKPTVSGNTANPNDTFEFMVTFSAKDDKVIKYPFYYSQGIDSETFTPAENGSNSASVTFSLKANATMTFMNLPEGLDYSITETVNNGYTVESIPSGTISAETPASVVVENTKSASISVGVFLDSMPYVILLAITVVGIVLLILRKRKEFED